MSLYAPSELLQRARPDWLVRGVVPGKALVLVWGESESFKTFTLLDLAGCIAAGRDWHGRPVQAGPVVYVAAEGSDAFRDRLAAWMQYHEVDPATLPFYTETEPVALLDTQAVDAFLEQLAARNLRTVALVVFDTWGMCSDGADENENTDFHIAARAMNRIRHELGATVALVAHGPETAPRGARAQKGDMDTLIFVRRAGETSPDYTLVCRKQKDAPRFRPIGCSMQEVDLGAGADGERITSLVVAAATGEARKGVGEEVGERGATARRTGAGARPLTARGGRRNGQPRRRGTGRTNWDKDRWYAELCQAADAGVDASASAGAGTEGVTPAALSRTTDRPANTCLHAMQQLVRKGRARAVGGGHYAPLPGSGRSGLAVVVPAAPAA